MPKARSNPTGYYMVCPASFVLHPRGITGLPIMRGPKQCYVFCPSCRTRVYMGPAWRSDYGYRAEQFRRQFPPPGGILIEAVGDAVAEKEG